MNLARVGAGAFLAVAASLFLPRPTHRENADASTIANIRTIHLTESELFSRYGRFARLSELGPAGAGFLGSELAEGRLQGETFLVRLSRSGYTIQTARIDVIRASFRSFYSDQTLVVRRSDGPDLATESSLQLK
jgi:hypothetical protein